MIIKKMNAPTHLDEAEYLTQWHHETDSGGTQIWVQTSQEGKPEWVRLGDLLERVWIKYGSLTKNGKEFCLENLNDWI